LPKAVNRFVGVFRSQRREIINIEKVEHTLTDLHNDYILLTKDWKKLKMPLLWSLVTNTCEIMTIYAVIYGVRRADLTQVR